MYIFQIALSIILLGKPKKSSFLVFGPFRERGDKGRTAKKRTFLKPPKKVMKKRLPLSSRRGDGGRSSKEITFLRIPFLQGYL